MKRKAHEVEVRRKIDQVARHLFQTQGYHKTTIRQIVEAAEIKTGTLYHFYKDKEEVFSNMVLAIFHRVLSKTDELVAAENKALQLACELSYHIHAITLSPQTAELYVVTYNSPSISEKILDSQLKRARALFSEKNPTFHEDDFMVRTMFIKGFMQSLSLKVLGGLECDPKFYITKATQIILDLHGYENEDAKEILEALELLNIEERVQAAMQDGVAMV